MGIRNLRAICPNCGAKIHTQPKGLGHVSLWMNSGPLVKTGTQCPMCGVALTGKVLLGNQAELAPQPPAPSVTRPEVPDETRVRRAKPRSVDDPQEYEVRISEAFRQLDDWEAEGRLSDADVSQIKELLERPLAGLRASAGALELEIRGIFEKAGEAILAELPYGHHPLRSALAANILWYGRQRQLRSKFDIENMRIFASGGRTWEMDDDEWDALPVPPTVEDVENYLRKRGLHDPDVVIEN